MEAIAREAGIAKPTLYAQFSDKDAVFTAILEQLVAAKIDAFDTGIAGEGPVAVRAGWALAEMYRVLAAALEGSAHAEELFSAHKRGTALFAEADSRIAGRLTAELRSAGAQEPERLTRLLLDAAYGLASKAITSEVLGADLMLLARRLVGPAVPSERQ
jgi:AcrR family transcriptional regulator